MFPADIAPVFRSSPNTFRAAAAAAAAGYTKGFHWRENTKGFHWRVIQRDFTGVPPPGYPELGQTQTSQAGKRIRKEFFVQVNIYILVEAINRG